MLSSFRAGDDGAKQRVGILFKAKTLCCVAYGVFRGGRNHVTISGEEERGRDDEEWGCGR